MISVEAPVLFSKACELFILELTLRSWLHTEENKRRTLHRNDIAGAISRGDVLDFLLDIVPRDEVKVNSCNAEIIFYHQMALLYIQFLADSKPIYIFLMT